MPSVAANLPHRAPQGWGWRMGSDGAAERL